MMAQAKLRDVRMFLYNEFPKTNAAIAGYGMFLLNYEQSNARMHLSDPIFFQLSALVNGDFYTLANEVMCCSPIMISPKSKELLARELSDYIRSCFQFQRITTILPYLPMHVFVLDIIIIVDPQASEESDDQYEVEGVDFFYIRPYEAIVHHGDPDALPRCDFNRFVVSTYLENIIKVKEVEESNADEFYQVLHDLRSLSLYSSEVSNKYRGFISDEAKHAEVALATASKAFLKIKPTLQLMHPQDFSEDCDCAICFEKLSSEHDVEITKFVQCNHAFHKSCIFKWLSKNQSCPYCRSSCFNEIYC